MADLIALARPYLRAGISVVPIRADGSKAPAVRWKAFRSRIASYGEVRSWPSGSGLAAVCGEVSGYLEVIDFDDLASFERFARRLEEAQPDLLARLAQVQTPRPGRHLYYRCPDGVGAHQDLARRKEPDGLKTLIETRGEGNLALLPGSPEACHPSGRAYELLHGDPGKPPEISAEERRLMLELACSLTEYVPPCQVLRPSRAAFNGDGPRPGDEFNRKADWSTILEPHGWMLLRTRGDGTGEWRRPGKDGLGLSATTDFGDSGLLYVFSTNAAPFQAHQAYTKFTAYAFLAHGADFASAARFLSAQGYGRKASFAAPAANGHPPAHPFFAFSQESPTPSKPRLEPFFASFASFAPPHKALHGLAGEVVRLIEPHTEADPAAILLQFLTAFGNSVGRRPHYQVEASRHGVNLFTVLVGKTSRARKGTSWDWVKRLFKEADPDWSRHRIRSGLSSGEGLIRQVRDSDGSNEDKRLLVVESEFGQVLRVAGRKGNVLSPTLRAAWDSGNLSCMTKHSPEKATAAHVSVIGHITGEELLRLMDHTEYSSGFANRFLWVFVQRSKELPDGGSLSEEELTSIAARVRQARKTAAKITRLERDKEAVQRWHDVYCALTEERYGLLGAVTCRAEAQVLRLSCLYALLDGSTTITLANLEAALAAWSYCDASCRHIFAAKSGDPVCDRLLKELRRRPEGMTRTEISALFKRHRSAAEIDRALALLAAKGLAERIKVQTGGRPKEIWRAATSAPPDQSTIH